MSPNPLTKGEGIKAKPKQPSKQVLNLHNTANEPILENNLLEPIKVLSQWERI